MCFTPVCVGDVDIVVVAVVVGVLVLCRQSAKAVGHRRAIRSKYGTHKLNSFLQFTSGPPTMTLQFSHCRRIVVTVLVPLVVGVVVSEVVVVIVLAAELLCVVDWEVDAVVLALLLGVTETELVTVNVADDVGVTVGVTDTELVSVHVPDVVPDVDAVDVAVVAVLVGEVVGVVVIVDVPVLEIDTEVVCDAEALLLWVDVAVETFVALAVVVADVVSDSVAVDVALDVALLVCVVVTVLLLHSLNLPVANISMASFRYAAIGPQCSF